MDYLYKENELYNLRGEEKEAYIDFSLEVHDAFFTKELRRSRDHISKEMESLPPKTQFLKRFLVWDGNKVIGNAQLMYGKGEQETNPDMCEIFIEVHPKYIKQGIGTELLRTLVNIAKDQGKTKVEIWASNVTLDGKVVELIRNLGLKQATEEKVNRLLKENINHDLLNNKLPELSLKLTNYQLSKFERNEYLIKIQEDEAFRIELADFYTEGLNMIPKEESERNDIILTPNDMMERAKTAVTRPFSGQIFILWDKNRIIGFSETYHPKNDVRGVNTGFTGVRKAYQRQGIALFLKLNMVKHYLSIDEFNQIDTENAQSNAGMIKINEDIGFKHVFSWYSHEGPIETIQEYLAKKQLVHN